MLVVEWFICLSDFLAFLSSSKHQVVSNGCILNQFEEKVRCAEECSVINVDKKQLKTICMLLRWKYFGYGLKRGKLNEDYIRNRFYY